MLQLRKSLLLGNRRPKEPGIVEDVMRSIRNMLFGKLEEYALGMLVAFGSGNVNVPAKIAIDIKIAGALHFEGKRHIAIDELVSTDRPVPCEILGLDGIVLYPHEPIIFDENIPGEGLLGRLRCLIEEMNAVECVCDDVVADDDISGNGPGAEEIAVIGTCIAVRINRTILVARSMHLLPEDIAPKPAVCGGQVGTNVTIAPDRQNVVFAVAFRILHPAAFFDEQVTRVGAGRTDRNASSPEIDAAYENVLAIVEVYCCRPAVPENQFVDDNPLAIAQCQSRIVGHEIDTGKRTALLVSGSQFVRSFLVGVEVHIRAQGCSRTGDAYRTFLGTSFTCYRYRIGVTAFFQVKLITRSEPVELPIDIFGIDLYLRFHSMPPQ
ncbi:hypothetical protein FHX06_003862 [Rhizobium sp. BK512]|uniref:hypothetical protein n=1 Tax=Rhizobium sp. BK512 TaxID=2587010 RepID=UPI0017C8D1B6|nr:hypothetical protein [Rhizobium sp. BK512]MBB3562519.1 hypothetical protein [Rhizobium sp. BK512]